LTALLQPASLLAATTWKKLTTVHSIGQLSLTEYDQLLKEEKLLKEKRMLLFGKNSVFSSSGCCCSVQINANNNFSCEAPSSPLAAVAPEHR